MTVEKLPIFIKHLTEDYEHDYGTICHAVAASALAAANAVNHSEQGGITGFQVGAIMWEFIGEWRSLKGKPLRLVDYENMLYPQYQDKFDKLISKGTWDWLQAEAKKRLESDNDGDGMHPDVKKHMENISKGVLPFGYEVGEE